MSINFAKQSSLAVEIQFSKQLHFVHTCMSDSMIEKEVIDELEAESPTVAKFAPRPCLTSRDISSLAVVSICPNSLLNVK